MLRQLFLAVVPSVKTRRVCAALWLWKILKGDEDVVAGRRGFMVTIEKSECGDEEEAKKGDAETTTGDESGTKRWGELFLQGHWGGQVLCH